MNIPKAVGRITNSKTGSSSTIVIAVVDDNWKKNPVFFSAGHNFAENGVLPQDFDFAAFKLELGSQPAFTLEEIADRLSTTAIIWYGSALVVKEPNLALREGNLPLYMDCFTMILDDCDGDVGSALKQSFQLSQAAQARLRNPLGY